MCEAHFICRTHFTQRLYSATISNLCECLSFIHCGIYHGRPTGGYLPFSKFCISLPSLGGVLKAELAASVCGVQVLAEPPLSPPTRSSSCSVSPAWLPQAVTQNLYPALHCPSAFSAAASCRWEPSLPVTGPPRRPSPHPGGWAAPATCCSAAGSVGDGLTEVMGATWTLPGGTFMHGDTQRLFGARIYTEMNERRDGSWPEHFPPSSHR